MVDVACVSGRCSRSAPVGTHPSRLSLMNAHLSPFISSSTVSPTPIAGAVLTPGSVGGGGAPGSPPSSVMFAGVSAAGSGHARAREGEGGLVFRGWRAEGRRGRRGRGTADGARRTNDFLTRSLSPRQLWSARRDQTRLVLPRFSKAASAAGPVPRCPRLITPGRAPRGATPSTSSATRARAGSRREATGANEETRPSRVKGRRRRRLRRLGRLGRWWNLRDRRRRRPPRRAPSTGPHAAKGTARSRARSSWRWSARLERSGKRTRGM